MSIYRSLIQPYLSYGVVAWGYAAKKYTDKLLKLQKRSFSRFGSLIWNSISSSLREQRKHIFKSKLTEILMTILQKENDHIDLPMTINRLPIETKMIL